MTINYDIKLVRNPSHKETIPPNVREAVDFFLQHASKWDINEIAKHVSCLAKFRFSEQQKRAFVQLGRATNEQ